MRPAAIYIDPAVADALLGMLDEYEQASND